MRLLVLLALVCVTAAGCATELPARPDNSDEAVPVVFGRALTVLTGPTTRWYQPTIRFVELEHQGTQQRFRVEMESRDILFTIPLPPGNYALTRVEISEGPFLGIADLNLTFTVHPDQLTYVGTWRIGLESPHYGRMAVVSVVPDPVERARVASQLVEEHPYLSSHLVTESLPEPATTQVRLYEVASYPRVQPYFRRRQW